jgi:hypothetical protein
MDELQVVIGFELFISILIFLHYNHQHRENKITKNEKS